MPPPPGSGRQSPSNGLATASLVLGILAIPLCTLVIPSILAVVFGAIGLSRSKQSPTQDGRGKAIAGLVLGSIALALMVLVFALGNAEITYGR